METLPLLAWADYCYPPLAACPIRVSIVEDDQAIWRGFQHILEHSKEVEWVAGYENAEEALQELPQALPEVVSMDISLPVSSGIECMAELKPLFPKLQIIMLTTYDDSRLIFDSLQAGASGYLLKRSAPLELLDAIKEVHQGGSPMSMKIARMVVSHFHQIKHPSSEVENLTKREKGNPHPACTWPSL